MVHKEANEHLDAVSPASVRSLIVAAGIGTVLWVAILSAVLAI